MLYFQCLKIERGYLLKPYWQIRSYLLESLMYTFTSFYYLLITERFAHFSIINVAQKKTYYIVFLLCMIQKTITELV